MHRIMYESCIKYTKKWLKDIFQDSKNDLRIRGENKKDGRLKVEEAGLAEEFLMKYEQKVLSDKKDITYVNLIVSKSRVASLKIISLPRLELFGALLAARLANKVKTIVIKRNSKFYFFLTDSNIILYWIQESSKEWKSFVTKRVNDFQSLCDTNPWVHSPGKLNPADILFRGVTIDVLLNSDIWWKGRSLIFRLVYDQISIAEDEVSSDIFFKS
ncbi:integrase catalytic domain-containing protein [Nephila pilipes]|uniref:Integrase catalytic domain-containing protein n=1 Tax=Nephila pilipes TaxID=299642 RepID=A0A8X6QKT5_NEPPI|nr:integrase catalytic domain-containing protein [Nephila pilipes]